jgi:hypothetical protein
MVPDSAIYQHPVPMPETKPPKIMYYMVAVLLSSKFKADTDPLVSKLAVAIVR